MLSEIIYIIAVFALFLLLFYLSLYTPSLIISFFMGSPFVKTNKKRIINIFKHIPIDRNMKVIDLGSGDGVVVRYIAKKFKCFCIGIDINPILIFRSIILSILDGVITRVKFKVQKIQDADLKNADIVYSFLLPSLTNSIKNKFLKEVKPGALIISHGFKLNFIDEWLIKVLPDHKFKTYIYKKPLKVDVDKKQIT